MCSRTYMQEANISHIAMYFPFTKAYLNTSIVMMVARSPTMDRTLPAMPNALRASSSLC